MCVYIGVYMWTCVHTHMYVDVVPAFLPCSLSAGSFRRKPLTPPEGLHRIMGAT